MSEISTDIIKEAVYKLCFEANTCLKHDVYSKILAAYNKSKSKILKTILQNAQIAYEKKLPLCQDTGQVIVFVEIGQNVLLKGFLRVDFYFSCVAFSTFSCVFCSCCCRLVVVAFFVFLLRLLSLLCSGCRLY